MPSAENDAAHSHVEYGVIVDRTSKGLGCWPDCLAAVERECPSRGRHQ